MSRTFWLPAPPNEAVLQDYPCPEPEGMVAILEDAARQS
jgi:hypothetical protein